MIIPPHICRGDIAQFAKHSGLDAIFKGHPDSLLVFANLVIDFYLKAQELQPSRDSVILLNKELKLLTNQLEKQIALREKYSDANELIVEKLNIFYSDIFYMRKTLAYTRKTDRRSVNEWYNDEKKYELSLITKGKHQAASFFQDRFDRLFSFVSLKS